MKTRLFILILFTTILSFARLGAHSSPMGLKAEEIVKRADQIRNPYASYSMEVKIVSIKPQKGGNTATLEVWIKGLDKSLVKFLKPDRDYGKSLLMIKQDLWIYMPNIRKPIRISPHQRLLGQVSYGDIARTNFSVDYIPQIVRIDKHEGKDAFILELNAKDLKVAYKKIVYWVDKDSFSPLKAEFYTISGKLMKTAYYQGIQDQKGRVVPKKLKIIDELRKGESSTIYFSNLLERSFSNSVFTKNYLKRLD